MDAVEREAIQQIVAGKAAGLEPLYDKYACSVKKWAHHEVWDNELAEDIAHKAFMELLRAGKENPLLSECESVEALLILFVNRIITDNRRYAIRQEEVLAELARQPVILPEQPDEVLEGKETNGLMTDAIGGLPQTLQPTADMKFTREMTSKEIAKLTGMPVKTVNTQAFRARRILARRLRCHFNRKQK